MSLFSLLNVGVGVVSAELTDLLLVGQVAAFRIASPAGLTLAYKATKDGPIDMSL